METIKFLFRLALCLAFSAAVAYVGAILAYYNIDHSDSTAIVSASVVGLVVLVILLKSFLSKNNPVEAITSDLVSFRETKEALQFKSDEHDDELYAQAEMEINDGIIDQGMWSRALVNASGSEELRKVEYMKLRVRQLRNN